MIQAGLSRSRQVLRGIPHHRGQSGTARGAVCRKPTWPGDLAVAALPRHSTLVRCWRRSGGCAACGTGWKIRLDVFALQRLFSSPAVAARIRWPAARVPRLASSECQRAGLDEHRTCSSVPDENGLLFAFRQMPESSLRRRSVREENPVMANPATDTDSLPYDPGTHWRGSKACHRAGRPSLGPPVGSKTSSVTAQDRHDEDRCAIQRAADSNGRNQV